MIHILWMSSAILGETSKSTGSWLHSMAKLLVESEEVKLTNITVRWGKRWGGVEYTRINDRQDEYVLPQYPARPGGGVPFAPYARKIKELVETINPDLIHCWGLEMYFSRLMPKIIKEKPLLLEIQGLRYEFADFYNGELNLTEALKCLGWRGILWLGKKSVLHDEINMRKQGEKDNQCPKMYKYISVQSEWVKNVLRFETGAKLFMTKMSIRSPFLENTPWCYPNDSAPCFYFSASAAIPYKSMQTAIKALAFVKKKYPSVRLRVGGAFKTKAGWRDSDYQRYLLKLIRRLDLPGNIEFLGSLSAEQIVEVMRTCVAAVQTSFVETYSLFNAEALSFGLPLISSYTTAVPELAKDGDSALYYQPGDFRGLASLMIQLIEDKELAARLSRNACKFNRVKHDAQSVLKRQLEIYKEILDIENGDWQK